MSGGIAGFSESNLNFHSILPSGASIDNHIVYIRELDLIIPIMLTLTRNFTWAFFTWGLLGSAGDQWAYNLIMVLTATYVYTLG